MKTACNSKTINNVASFLSILSLSMAVGLTGCQQEGTAEKAGQKIDQAAEKTGKKIESAKEAVGEKVEQSGVYIDDAAITAKVKAEIMNDPLLKVLQINVTTTKGVVTLTGAVDTQLSIDRAVEVARSVKDVKSVESALVVKTEK